MLPLFGFFFLEEEEYADSCADTNSTVNATGVLLLYTGPVLGEFLLCQDAQTAGAAAALSLIILMLRSK